MSDSKEIKIRAVLDSSTFDRGITEIQEKLKKITQQQNQGAGASQALGKDTLMGKYAQSAFGDFSKESQRQLEQMYQTQRREAVNQNISLKGKQTELAKMAQIDGEMTKQQKERNESLKKEIELLKEKQRITLGIAAETQKTLDKMKPVAGGAGGGAGEIGGPGSPASTETMSSFSNILKTIGTSAVLKGVMNAAATAYSDFAVTRSSEIEKYKGLAMKGAGRETIERYEGQGSSAAMYASERARAFGIASKQRQAQENLDVGWGAGKVGGTALLGAAIGTGIATTLAGTMIGATMGAAAPVVPWVLAGGAALGAAAGSAIGYSGTSDRERASLFDREKYKKMSMAEMLQNRETIEASMIMQDPNRAYARDTFMRDYKGMSDFERRTGVRTNEGMYGEGGLLQTQMRKGMAYGGSTLSELDIKEQINQMYATGGSTASANISGLAASINRQFGVSNAGAIFGTGQGQGGLNNPATIEMYKKLMVEAEKAGISLKGMTQELESFTEISSKLATRGGGMSAGITELMSAALTGTSLGQQKAAASATQAYQDIAKTSSGLPGEVGYAFIKNKGAEVFGENIQSKILSDPQMMQSLNQYSAEDLQKDPKMLQGMASILGISPEKLLEGKRKMDADKQMSARSTDKALKAYGESPDSAEAYARANMAVTSEKGEEYSRLGLFERQSILKLNAGLAAGTTNLGSGVMTSPALEAGMVTPPTSAAEKERASEAAGQLEKIKNMNKYLDEFAVAAEKSSKLSGQFAFMLEAVEKALAKNGPGMEAEITRINQQLQKFSDQMAKSGFHSTEGSQ